MNVTVMKAIIKAQPKTFILIFVLALSNTGLFVYASAYQTPRLESLQSAWSEKRKSATAPDGAVLDTAYLYRQGENDLKAWRARILQKKEFARFVGSLFETAASNSLAFKGVSYRASQLADENLVTYALDFNVTGKYGAVKSFIADLERMREMMTIDNVSLTTSKATEDAVALKVQMTVYLRMEGQ